MVPENVILAPDSIERVHLRSDPFPEFKFMTIVRVAIGPSGGIARNPRSSTRARKGGTS